MYVCVGEHICRLSFCVTLSLDKIDNNNNSNNNNTVSEEGYSLHESPRDQGLHAKQIRAVKVTEEQLGRTLGTLIALFKAFRA